MLGFFLMSLLVFAISVFGEANQLSEPILYPGVFQVIDRPEQVFQQAAAQGNLVLLKAAIFDPQRDGEPDLSGWVRNDLKDQPLSARYCLVQFGGPIRPEHRQALEKAGARVIEYIPNNALLVRIPAGQGMAVHSQAGVRWVGEYQPAYKLAANLAVSMKSGFAAGEKHWQISVDVFPGEDLVAVVEAATERFVTDPQYNFTQGGPRTVVFDVSTERLADLLTFVVNRNEVRWVEQRPQDEPLNDNSIWVCQSGDTVGKSTPIFAKGILGQGQVVAVADSGIDKDHCAFIPAAGAPVIASQTVDPPALLTTDPSQRKLIAYNVLDGAADGDHSVHYYHGTHVSGSAAGDDYHHLAAINDPGHDMGDGMAPMAQLIFEDGGNGSSQYLYFPWPFYDLWAQELAAGAHIGSNSWGSDNNEYNIACSYTDQFVWDNEGFLICVAAGNSGPGIQTLNYLSTAKNVVCVGATSNGSEGANYIPTFSSKGPADDGRLKPDVVVPGDWVNSAEGATQANNCDTWQMGGTSMSCPTLAGLAALARQYFVEGWYPTGARDGLNSMVPSAALLKAVLVSSAVNLTGGNTGQPKEDAPAIGQGWGRTTLDTALYFASDTRQLLVWDVPNAQGVSTGGVREYPITVAAGQPLKVTLAWTDPPGSSAAAIALVDNLDLEVVGPTGTVYRGNQWNGTPSNDTKESAADPAGADALNNVEGVLLRTPAAGNYAIRVKGTNVPGYGLKFMQGFGLVATGGVAIRNTGIINIKSVTIDDGAGNGNGVIDPGETINLFVDLENSGSATAGSVNAVLSTTASGVNVTVSNSGYGTIAGLTSKPNSPAYVFTVASSVASSTVLNFTLNITTASAGNFQRTFQLKVKPFTPPVMSNFEITEKNLQDPNYPFVNLAMQFDYADPDIDLAWSYIWARINGREVNTLPFVINASSLTTPDGTGVLDPFAIWYSISTVKGERVQLYGYLEDQQGNKSPIVSSNEVTFTKGPNAPTTVNGLEDDDTIHYDFPSGFVFPFYGKEYTDCWINSDGNITFEAGYEYQARHPASFLNNMPRIAGLYTDLAKNPSDNKITIEAFADHITFHYVNLPQWSSVAPVGSNTVHISLYLDGSIEFEFGNCTMSQSQEDDEDVKWKGVVGIHPGAYETYAMVDLSAQSSPIPIPSGAPVYQGFRDTDTFDLSNTTLRFEPPSFFPLQTVYFPRMSFNPGAWAEGYGFVNTGAAAADVRFTAYGPAGTELETSDLVSWPAHGQGAYQIDGVLGLTQATDGWVVAESNQAGMLGFFLTQHFTQAGLAGLDGAEVFAAPDTEAYIPRVQTTGTYSTELFLANPTTGAVDVTLTGIDGAATHTGGVVNIPAMGFRKLDVATQFGTAFDGAVKVTSTGGIIGNAVIKDGDAAISSVNLIPTQAAYEDLTAAHVVLFPDVYYTEVNLINPHAAQVTATVTPFRADGTQVTAPFDVIIPAGQVVTLRDTQLGLPSGESTEGYLTVAASQSILGCLTFGNPVDNHYMSTLPLQAVPSTDMYFAQAVNGNVGGVDFFTGIAILNPTAGEAEVTIQVYGSDGTLLGTATRTLAAGEKYVRMIQSIEGIGSLPAMSSGYIHVSSPSSQLYSFVLFGDLSLNFLSAVPAQVLPVR